MHVTFGAQKWKRVIVTSAKHYSINNDLTAIIQYDRVGFDRGHTANLVNVTQKRKRWIPMTQIDLKYNDVGKLKSYFKQFVKEDIQTTWWTLLKNEKVDSHDSDRPEILW